MGSWTEVDVDLVVRQAAVAGRDRPVDIAVRGDRIARIAPSIPDRGAVEIDAAGRLVTPGLVEPHLHLDAVLTFDERAADRGLARNALAQSLMAGPLSTCCCFSTPTRSSTSGAR